MPTTVEDPKTVERQVNPVVNPVDIEHEYVSGQEFYAWKDQIYRSLPPYIDDVTRDFGDDLYDRMMYDPQVSSCVHILKMGILARPIQITPRTGEQEAVDKVPAESKDVASFCVRCMKRLKRLRTNTLYNMLDAMPYGNKVAEQIYTEQKYGQDRGKWVLKALKVKPRNVLSFVVDPYQNLIGLITVIPGHFPILRQGLIMEPKRLPNLLPREKFAVLTFREKDGDPRGQSILRAAYNPWWLKLSNWPEYLKYLAQFAGPSIVGTTPPNAQRAPKLDILGNPAKDDQGNIIMVSPEQAQVTALQNVRNGSVASFPYGSTIQPLQMQGDGRSFTTAIDLFDLQITKAILCQTLATEQGQYQVRAAAQVHENVLGMVIQFCRTDLEEMIVNDILVPLITYNFGEDYLEFLPEVSLGDVEQHDFAAMAKAVASLQMAGYITPSQRQAIDALLGLPVRTIEEARAAEPPNQFAKTDRQGGPGKKTTVPGGDDAPSDPDEPSEDEDAGD